MSTEVATGGRFTAYYIFVLTFVVVSVVGYYKPCYFIQVFSVVSLGVLKSPNTSLFQRNLGF